MRSTVECIDSCWKYLAYCTLFEDCNVTNSHDTLFSVRQFTKFRETLMGCYKQMLRTNQALPLHVHNFLAYIHQEWAKLSNMIVEASVCEDFLRKNKRILLGMLSTLAVADGSSGGAEGENPHEVYRTYIANHFAFCHVLNWMMMRKVCGGGGGGETFTSVSDYLVSKLRLCTKEVQVHRALHITELLWPIGAQALGIYENNVVDLNYYLTYVFLYPSSEECAGIMLIAEQLRALNMGFLELPQRVTTLDGGNAKNPLEILFGSVKSQIIAKCLRASWWLLRIGSVDLASNINTKQVM